MPAACLSCLDLQEPAACAVYASSSSCRSSAYHSVCNSQHLAGEFLLDYLAACDPTAADALQNAGGCHAGRPLCRPHPQLCG